MPVTTNTWLGATTAQPLKAAQINQFLGIHKQQNLYAATQQAGQTTNGSTTTSTNSLWLAQSFTTGASQTAIGYVIIPLTTVSTSGSSLAPTTLSIYANSGGAPTGSALASVTVTAEYANLASGGTTTNRLIYPVPVTGLTASTTYWIVVQGTSSSGVFAWFRSNQTSGASTSPTGATWTAQTYGFVFQVFDQSVSGLLTSTWEDSGARWTATTYVANTKQIGTYAEYTNGQTTAGYTQGFRTFTYSNGFLTKVA